jgi:hypothetical protein
MLPTQFHRQPRHAQQPIAFLPHPFLDSTRRRAFKRFQQSNLESVSVKTGLVRPVQIYIDTFEQNKGEWKVDREGGELAHFQAKTALDLQNMLVERLRVIAPSAAWQGKHSIGWLATALLCDRLREPRWAGRIQVRGVPPHQLPEWGRRPGPISKPSHPTLPGVMSPGRKPHDAAQGTTSGIGSC